MGFKNNSFTAAERKEFIRAYSTPGSTSGAFHWFGYFEQDAKDNLEFAKHKITMPVLTMGSDHFAAPFLATHIKLVATDVQESTIKDSGHWVVQEIRRRYKATCWRFFSDNLTGLTSIL